MKQAITDHIKKITDNAASKAYVSMTQLNLSIKNNPAISGGGKNSQLAKGCVDIATKEFFTALTETLNKIDRMNIRLKDEDISFLKTTFDAFANDMLILVKRIYHGGEMIAEPETVRIQFQALGENLHIKLNDQIDEYVFINKHKRLPLPDKLGYGIGIAGIIIGVIIAIIF